MIDHTDIDIARRKADQQISHWDLESSRPSDVVILTSAILLSQQMDKLIGRVERLAEAVEQANS